jgi:hypothetical protein
MKGKWVVTSILIVTLLFFGIVTKFWLSGQKRRFITKREQIIEKIQKNSNRSQTALEAEIEEFNFLVSNHLFLIYLNIPKIEYKK